MAPPIPPGSTIGIIGGGQLGRMLALAAAALGYRCDILCPEADSPAGQVAASRTVADYEDTDALDRFASRVDVATFEFENIPVATVEHLAHRVPVHPSADVLRVTQDRLLEKDFVRRTGADTVPYAALATPEEIETAAARVGGRGVLKTRRFGYDGKGQLKVEALAGAAAGTMAATVAAAWTELGRVPCILETFVDFASEVSVIVARGQDGRVAAYDPVENRHVRHVLDTTLAPAAVPERTAEAARSTAVSLAARLDYVGVLAVEMFLRRDGRLLVNELAPRVHNSGHWTIEACSTSQFEQHVRAICGLPLGSPERHSNARMQNLVGEAAHRWPELLADPHNKVHLYGKAEARAGRKMGHVTRLYPLNVVPR